MGAAETTLKMLLLGEDRSLSKTLKGAGDAAEGVGHKFGGVSSLVKGALAAGAGLAIVKFGKDSVDAFKSVGGETLALQRRIGGTPEQVSRLNFAFHETGVSAETAQKGLGIFEKNLVSSQASGKKTSAMVKALGFDFRDAHGHVKPMAEILPEVADKFQKMPAGAEKTALAMKLFGKSGADMLPFLNKGKEGIAELQAESDKLGHTLSGKDLDAIKENKKAHREWNAAVEGVKIQFGSQLLPILNEFMAFLVSKGIPAIAQFIAGMKNGTGPGGKLKEILHQVHDVVVKLLGFMGGHIGTLTQFGSGLSGLMVVTKVAGATSQLFKILAGNPIGAVITLVAMLALYLIHAYQSSATFRNVVDTAFRAVGSVARWLWNSVFQPVIRFIVNGFATLCDWVGNFLDALGHIPGFGWARDAAAKMHGAADAARGLANSINKIPDNTTVNVTTRFIYKGYQAALSKANDAKLAANGIKAYASGGTNLPEGWALVGEQGPELMYVPGGSTVVPAGATRRALAGRGGGSAAMGGSSDGQPLIVQMVLDGRVVHQSLLKLKRMQGGGLGLED